MGKFSHYKVGILISLQDLRQAKHWNCVSKFTTRVVSFCNSNTSGK